MEKENQNTTHKTNQQCWSRAEVHKTDQGHPLSRKILLAKQVKILKHSYDILTNCLLLCFGSKGGKRQSFRFC